jgi:hypothetical protein
LEPGAFKLWVNWIQPVQPHHGVARAPHVLLGGRHPRARRRRQVGLQQLVQGEGGGLGDVRCAARPEL